LIQITDENDNSNLIIKNHDGGKNIVVLFPMTKGIDVNLIRWQKLISTVNSSRVAALVLIDKTPFRQATNYFVEKEKHISTDVFIIQRPSTEAIHDSQSRIRLKDNLWIIQLHDDDEWEGVLEIPIGIEKNSVIRTNFTITNGDLKENITEINRPDCRAIFSLLPGVVWNRFVDLINAQGGHVAGSIDSSLNLAVDLITPNLVSTNFRYLYDNRHWNSKKNAKKNLINLTTEDGWGEFATIEISLVARAIDGIASLIFFSDLYSNQDYSSELKSWIEKTKPHILRILINRIELTCLILVKRIFGNITIKVSSYSKSNCDSIILQKNILNQAWNASEISDYLLIVELLIKINSLKILHPRFYFWKSQLQRYIK
jgi:hypothetical protein